MAKIGISFWGSLSGNLKDSPDGAVYFRNIIIKKLLSEGHKVCALQMNRDEEYFAPPIPHYSDSFPELDVLFVEWRWPIPGRNTEDDRNSDGYTPDLHRQNELLMHYLQCENVEVFIWDKDQTITHHDLYGYPHSKHYFVRSDFKNALKPNVHFCRNILKDQVIQLSNGHVLVFEKFNLPCDFESMKYEGTEKFLKKIDDVEQFGHFTYIGNQYQRDDQVYKYIVPAAAHFNKENLNVKFDFYGNWTKYPEKYARNLVNFPFITFKDRVPFSQIHGLYDNYLFTINMAPRRYREAGQFTQRIYEATMNGILSFDTCDHYGVEQVTPLELILSDATDLVQKIKRSRGAAKWELKYVFEHQVNRLEKFDIKYWYNKFEKKIINAQQSQTLVERNCIHV